MESVRNGNGPVVGLDIDGTLGDYHGHFLSFAQAWYGRAMPDPNDINPGLPLHKFMETSKATYRQCKLAYRQGGLERSMPAYPGADELTRQIRKAGAELWLCTTRPYLKMDSQSPNTIHWLKRNHIQYDHMLSGPHKYRDLIKQVKRERVVCIMDDLPEMCEQAGNLNLNVLMRDQPYNKHVGYNRVYNLEQAQGTILCWIENWKRAQNA